MTRWPTLYLSHGAPPLADDATWTTQLRGWSADLQREMGGAPSAILMISAHWEAAPVTLSSTTGAPLTYDFWGFPQKYYEVTYDAPPAPGLAEDVRGLLAPLSTVVSDESRGLDHGAYVPLVEMFPDAQVPTIQLSMPTLDEASLVDLGRRLAPLRDQGVLVIGSGFTTHNLRWFSPSGLADAPAPTPSREFDHWAAERVAAGDLDSLIDWRRTAPAALEAHPRSEHWAPLFVALGAAQSDASATTAIDGFWYGLSKRSWTFA